MDFKDLNINGTKEKKKILTNKQTTKAKKPLYVFIRNKQRL